MSNDLTTRNAIDDDDQRYQEWKLLILELIVGTQLALEKLGEAYVRVPQHWRDRLTEEFPEKPAIFWRRLEALGHGEIDYRLVYMRNALAQKLQRLPKRIQVDVLDHGVDYLGNSGEILHASVETLDKNPDLVKRVFGTDHVRKVEEQRAWLEAQKSSIPSGKVFRPLVEVIHGRVRINPPNGGQSFEITKDEWATVLNELI
jgi:hypothetical protein